MEQTTALRKIAGMKKRIRGIQGGQGAGKTFAIMMLIINHASGNPNKQCYVISAELSKMRDTVLKDTITILQSFGIRCTILGKDSGQAKVIFPNGSFIRFIGMDKDDIGKGLRSDIVFINEANKINFESYREATSRAKKVFIDFNPNAKFWFHKEIESRADCQFIKLTFLDNEFISRIELSEILLYHLMGYGVEFDPDYPNEEHPIIGKYWANKWRVYGKGEIGIIEGAVYENWDVIDELPKEAKLIGLGVDFGWEHPQACIACYEWNKLRIYDEVSYGSHKGTVIMARHIKEQGLQNEVAYCDNSAPQLISELRDSGVNAVKCYGKTGLINFAVEKMNRDVFYVTKRSKNIISELHGYVWGKDSKGNPTGKPIDLGDDAMNAIQYFEGTEGRYSGAYR